MITRAKAPPGEIGYSPYGLWSVYSTMSKHFKVNTSTYEAGVKIAKFVPIYYFLLIAKNIFDRYLGRLPVEESFSSIWFISFVADGILILIYILLLKTVSAGLLALSELHATDDEEKSTEVF